MAMLSIVSSWRRDTLQPLKPPLNHDQGQAFRLWSQFMAVSSRKNMAASFEDILTLV